MKPGLHLFPFRPAARALQCLREPLTERGAMSEPERTSRLRGIAETLGSVKLGVGLLIGIAAASALGTAILQTSLAGADPSEIRARYGACAGFLNTVGLTDVFHSTWYAVLLGILALNIVSATATRFAFRASKLGMLLAHVGVLVVLTGGLVYSLIGDKGYVVLGPRQETDRYVSNHSGQRLGHLPFTLRLDDFAAERYPARLTLVGPQGEILTVTPKEGAEVTPSWTSAAVKFEKILPHAERTSRVIDDGNAPIYPAALVRLNVAGASRDLWCVAQRSSPAETLVDGNGRISVAFDNELTARANDLPAEPRAYAVSLQTGRTVEIPVKPGAEFPLPNAAKPGAWGKVRTVVDDADNTALGPALTLELHEDNQTFLRSAVARMPGLSPELFRGEPVGMSDLAFVYYRPKLSVRVTRMEDWIDRKAPPRYRVEWWTFPSGTGGKLDNLAVGSPETLDATGATITLVESLLRAQVDAAYTPLDRGGMEAAKVKVTWPDGPPREYWLATEGPEQMLRVTQALAFLYSAREEVREYRADVRLQAPSFDLAETVTVNHPASILGWQIFLSDIREAPTPRAQLMVSCDPGLPLVYAGLVLLALGAFVAQFRGKAAEQKGIET